MGRNFWPIFIIAAAVSTVAVWELAPRVGPALPISVRDMIHDTFQPSVRGARTDASGGAPAPASAGTTPAAVQPPATNAGPAKSEAKQAAPVAQTSPYLKPAADALREYRKLQADLEKRKDGLGLDEQRRMMKKLHALNERVEYFNRKHREWKNAHPAASGAARR